jgi:predicted HTH transcriptional regulator
VQQDIVQDILRREEGLTIEFKQAKNELSKSLFETVCAFLNREESVIFKYSELYSESLPKVNEEAVFEVTTPVLTTPKIRMQILDYISVNPKTSIKKMAEVFGLSKEGVRYHIRKLKKDQKITFQGSLRAGKWVVLNNEDKK